ncbi:60S ribosomal protein L31 [Coelomomyces lativittatus]|nr:60S ribosomal protein L31 [Coelomomyces lativittatus]KAJ1513019.1 60S ribosomal protein L31 [Coelomomyces lativittatus]KAJ1515049.1 60S ribosomal protein L31 [Coelomomyces lativittatus]
MSKKQPRRRPATKDVVAREYTVHLHRYLHGKTFKRRAPTAIKVLKEFAFKHMKTKDVRIAPEVNLAIWGRGIKSVPHRLRVRISRKRNDDPKAKEPLYSLVEYVEVPSVKGLCTIEVQS